MKLAWQNIIHDRARFSVTVLGVSFAVFLMVFQGSLFSRESLGRLFAGSI